MRRGADDSKWQAVKKKVDKRDKGIDRILQVGTFKDIAMLKRSAPFMLLQKIDPAHIIAVSSCPDIMYDENNIISLNRYSHEHLDNCKHPITGTRITKEQRRAWWERLAGPEQWAAIEHRYPSL